MKSWRRYLRFWGRDVDADVADELSFHLESRIAEYRAHGLSLEEAERAARQRLGDLEAIAGSLRAHDAANERRVLLLEQARSLLQDGSLALRALRASPVFVVTVVATLSVAIAACTVIASAAEALLRHPLAPADISDVVTLGHYNAQSRLHSGLMAAELFDLERRPDLFRAIAGYRSVGFNLTGMAQPRYISGITTSGDFFGVFGIAPYVGRFYGGRAELDGPSDVAVLGYGLWRDLTGGDRRIVGKTIRLNDSSFTVIGVAPPGFEYPLGAQLWTPRPLDVLLDRHASTLLQHAGAIVPTIARPRRGVTPDHLGTALAEAARAWEEREPQYYTLRRSVPLELRRLGDVWAGKLRPIVLTLIGASAFLIVIACANVGALLLLRATGRTREIAVRIALGAGRSRVARAFLVETAIVAIAGGAFGVGLAELLLSLLGSAAAWRVPELYAVRIDPFVVSLAIGVTSSVALLCAAAPMFRAFAVDPRECLAGTRHSFGASRSRFLRTAIVLQVAASVVLTLGCLVAVRSLEGLLATDTGFDAKHVITAEMYLPQSRYNSVTLSGAVRALPLHEALMARLRSAPGIEAASSADIAPFGFHDAFEAATHRTVASADVAPAGQTSGPAYQHAVTVDMWQVDAGYFHAMGIPMLEGSGFTGHEQEDQVRAYPRQLQVSVVIDRTLAERLFPGQNPVGKLIGPWSPGMRIVGVVGVVKQSDLTASQDVAGALYWVTAGTQARQTIIVRTRESVAAVSALLERTIHDLDPELAIHDVRPLTALISRSLGAREVAAWLLSAFAALSLLLCCLGVFGVVNYTMSQRAKELGIRLALGALRRDVAAIVVGSAARLVLVGAVIGAAAYVAGERWIRALAYGIDANALSFVAGVAMLLVIVALAASLPVAWRATRIDPVTSLRGE